RTVAVAVSTCLLVALAMASPARAAAALRLSKRSGPPTTTTVVRGQGFGASETVDLSVDSAPAGTVSTGAGGRFAASVQIPATALPGDHIVAAVGETSGASATATFTVRTDWSRFRFTLDRAADNPYENVLDPSTVPGLTLKWMSVTGNVVLSSPAIVGGVVYV